MELEPVTCEDRSRYADIRVKEKARNEYASD